MSSSLPWIPAGAAWTVYLFSFSASDWVILHGCIPCILLGFLWMMAAEYRHQELRRMSRARWVPDLKVRGLGGEHVWPRRAERPWQAMHCRFIA